MCQSGQIVQSGKVAQSVTINIACLGNMTLSNCAEFDNITLNCFVGTKFSIAGYFPFAHLFDTIFQQLSPGKILTRRKSF